MADEKATDVQDRHVRINWMNINVPSIVVTIATVGGVGWSVSNYIGKLESRVESMERYREQVKVELSTLDNVPYRVNILEQQATAINLRIDRFTEVIGATMELIRRDVNGLGTKVEVLSEKIDNLGPRQRTGLTPDNTFQ